MLFQSIFADCAAALCRSSFSRAVRPRRTRGLRLEALEGRDVPAPLVTNFSGALSDTEEHHSFPTGSKIKEIPSGSKVVIGFDPSPNPSGKYKAEIKLKDGKGSTLRTATVGLKANSKVISYDVTTKSAVPWDVTFRSVGKKIEGLWPYGGKATITLPDISVPSASYIGGSESAHTNPTGVKATVAMPKNFKETFKVELFRSKDGTEPTGGVLASDTVTGDGKGGSKSVTLDTKAELFGQKDVPFLVVIVDHDKKVDEDNEENNTKSLTLPFVRLEAGTGPATMTLMKDVNVVVKTDGGSVSGYRLENKGVPDPKTTYVTVASGSSEQLTFKPKLANTVEFLGSVSAESKRFYGRPQTRTVHFPDIADIMADADVIAAADNLWSQTKGVLAISGGLLWYEFGAYINLDTASGKYSFGPICTGANNTIVNGAPTRATVQVTGAGDKVDQSTQTGKYFVAWFHTHPDDHRRANFLNSRAVGPSPDDLNTSANAQVPGLVYDYDGQGMEIRDPRTDALINAGVLIRGGWLLDAPAHIYSFGPTQRQH
ncbi:MAG TPA: hypothetical protein VHR66_21955 [Gemmataceae bacterium]|jgi:hypothetical protein|nr:hypothetical protein [Gemmataceae bacterium]